MHISKHTLSAVPIVVPFDLSHLLSIQRVPGQEEEAAMFKMVDFPSAVETINIVRVERKMRLDFVLKSHKMMHLNHVRVRELFLTCLYAA